MRYFALATDYDGTLATNGKVSEATWEALKKLRESGRKLILVTGRHLEDAFQVFPEAKEFDCIVAENGALIHFPATLEEYLLGDRPSEAFIQALRSKQVQPLGVGKVIIDTWEPHDTTVFQTIREFGLELQVIFNKGAVMVLPSGVNKAAGLKMALSKMGLSPHNVVAVGDAENDHAFLDVCEVSVAVANALPAVKEKVDWVTEGSRGDGVIELIDRLITNDLEELTTKLNRHNIEMGHREDGSTVEIQPTGTSILIAGTSGGGKSTLATGILERLGEQGYQFCIIDPEGDYESFHGAVVLGDGSKAPRLNEMLDVLEKPGQNLVINMLGVKLEDRPAFFAGLLPSLIEMRAKTGRPHWLVIDETHHMLPASWHPAAITLPQSFSGVLMITVHPNHVAAPALNLVDAMIAIGKTPHETIASFCEVIGHCPPETQTDDLPSGEGMVWFAKTEQAPFKFKIQPPQMERQRHMRNYAEGTLGDDKCFYFRGAEEKMNLRAQNLIMFTQLAEGIDDDTWMHHLQQQDYSRWFLEAIKDEELAEETAAIEQAQLSASESREQIKTAIGRRYTLPA